MSRQKQFTKRQVERKIENVLKTWKNKKLEGTTCSLRKVIGDYTNISMFRYIKETLFYGMYGTFAGSKGAVWYLKHPKKMNAKKLAKKVMKAVNVT
jgi:ribosomal protein L22